MLIKLSASSLKQTRWYEYGIRFVLGGLATVGAGVIATWFGVAAGGLFLALPAIFCASATLIESHERHTKEKAGFSGRRRGQEAAALDAAGAALGSIGLAAFALVFCFTVSRSTIGAFAAAVVTWAVVSVSAWWLRRKIRHVSHHRQPERWSQSARRGGFP
jgi:membrane protein implicated in regulation of membrane protease activity